MNTKIFLILSSILLTISTNLISFAQTAEQIDIKSMEISKVGSAGVTSFRMEALNSAQNTVIYQGPDSAALGIVSFTVDCPCRPPKLYNSNVFRSEMIANLGTSIGLIRFYISASESSPFALNQQLFFRKKDFSVTGQTKLQGRLEVRNGSDIVVAFDNDVVLEGGYSIVYGKPYLLNNGRRYTDFRSLTYTLNAP